MAEFRGAAEVPWAPWAGSHALRAVIHEHDGSAAVELARVSDARVGRLGRTRLWHGDAGANWAVVDVGLAAGVDVRGGLGDTLFGRDVGERPPNAGRVTGTVAASPER